MCIDLNVLLDKPGTRQPEGTPTSAKGNKSAVEQTSLESIVWRCDMWDYLKAYYHHTASSSVLVHENYVYVCTGNGRSWVPGRIPYSPLSPSLVVFNKMTGQLVARDDETDRRATLPRAIRISIPGSREREGSNTLCHRRRHLAMPLNRLIQQCTSCQIVRRPTSLRGPIVHFIDVEGKDTRGLSPSEYAQSVDLLSTLPKPALPLEFRFSKRVAGHDTRRYHPHGDRPRRAHPQENMVLRLHSAGLQEGSILPA